MRTGQGQPHLPSTHRAGVLQVRVAGAEDDGGVRDHLRPLWRRLLLVADTAVEILVWPHVDNEGVNVASTFSTSEALLVIDLTG